MTLINSSSITMINSDEYFFMSFFYYLHIFFCEVTLLCPFYKLDSLFCIQALCRYMFCEYFLPSLWIVNFLSLAVSFHEQTLNFDNVWLISFLFLVIAFSKKYFYFSLKIFFMNKKYSPVMKLCLPVLSPMPQKLFF